MKKTLGVALVFLLALMLVPSTAQADSVALTINPSTQTVLQGGVLTFTGTLDGVDPGAGTLYINGDSFGTSPDFGFVLDPSLLTTDDTDFIFNAPLTMSADGSSGVESAIFDLFTVTVGSAVAPGTYLGTFFVVGGADSGAQVPLTSADFQINVSQAVPEPSSILLLGVGLFVLVAMGKRQARLTRD